MLIAFVECGRVDQAATAAGVGRRTHYDWLRDDPEYAEAFAEAEKAAARLLEDEAFRRAHDGVRRVKFGKDGSPLIDPATGGPYIEHIYSDILLIFLLKGLNPNRYRDKVDHRHLHGHIHESVPPQHIITNVEQRQELAALYDQLTPLEPKTPIQAIELTDDNDNS